MTRVFLTCLLFFTACSVPAETISTAASDIYWSDGDSGRINGMKFRLADVDAPETGGVGARGGAKCEYERELGFEAKAFMVDLTRDAELTVTERSGADRYGREVIRLSANGKDVADAGVLSGHSAAWPHRGRKALTDKPDWCAGHSD